MDHETRYKIVVFLTEKEIKDLEYALDECDVGPRHEGWKSPQRRNLCDVFDDAIMNKTEVL